MTDPAAQPTGWAVMAYLPPEGALADNQPYTLPEGWEPFAAVRLDAVPVIVCRQPTYDSAAP